jgi:hypothetical protein
MMPVMTLSLFTSTVLAALVLLLLGGLYLWSGELWKRAVCGFGRSIPAAWVTMGLGGGWFLWKIWNLSQADFGDYRMQLFLFFGVVILGSFWVVRDFLAVRGAAILSLLLALEGLKSAFGWYELPQRLWLVSLLYLLILLALFLGTVPFYWRNWHAWLYAADRPVRARILGAVLTGYGLILLVTAFSY